MKQPKNGLRVQTNLPTEGGIELGSFAVRQTNVSKRANSQQGVISEDDQKKHDDLAIITLLDGDPIQLGIFPENSPAYRMWISLQNQDDNMTNLRARRVLEANRRLRIDLNRRRRLASNGCLQLIRYTQDNSDELIPQVDGYVDYEIINGEESNLKGSGCCVVC
jgi:hypothetical protein